MSRVANNPDRDFSADGPYELDGDGLRALLRRGDVAEISEPEVQQRVGATIAGVFFESLKFPWKR